MNKIIMLFIFLISLPNHSYAGFVYTETAASFELYYEADSITSPNLEDNFVQFGREFWDVSLFFDEGFSTVNNTMRVFGSAQHITDEGLTYTFDTGTKNADDFDISAGDDSGIKSFSGVDNLDNEHIHDVFSWDFNLNYLDNAGADEFDGYSLLFKGKHTSITTAVIGDQAPSVGALGATAFNGDFTIVDSGPTGSFNMGVGDGIDEVTTWQFDFTTDPNFNYFSQGTMESAILDLQLTPKHSLFNTDSFQLKDLPMINLTDTEAFEDLEINVTQTISIDLLDFYSQDDIFSVITNNDVVPALFQDDAIVSYARLTVNTVPVPEANSIILLLSCLALLVLKRVTKNPENGRYNFLS